MLKIDKNLKDQLPTLFKKIKDYDEILNAEQEEIDALADRINQVHDNYFPQNMDEDTVANWEQLLKISVLGGETLEFRRQRILAKIATNPPFSIAYLQQRLDEILGEGNSEVEVDYAAQTLTVTFTAASYLENTEVLNLVNSIKPAHIAVEYVTQPPNFPDITVGIRIRCGTGLVPATMAKAATLDFQYSNANPPNKIVTPAATAVSAAIDHGTGVISGSSKTITVSKTGTPGASGSNNPYVLDCDTSGYSTGRLTAFNFRDSSNTDLIKYSNLSEQVSNATDITQKITIVRGNPINPTTVNNSYKGLIDTVLDAVESLISSVHITYGPMDTPKTYAIGDWTRTKTGGQIHYSLQAPESGGVTGFSLYGSGPTDILASCGFTPNKKHLCLHMYIEAGIIS